MKFGFVNEDSKDIYSEEVFLPEISEKLQKTVDKTMKNIESANRR